MQLGHNNDSSNNFKFLPRVELNGHSNGSADIALIKLVEMYLKDILINIHLIFELKIDSLENVRCVQGQGRDGFDLRKRAKFIIYIEANLI